MANRNQLIALAALALAALACNAVFGADPEEELLPTPLVATAAPLPVATPAAPTPAAGGAEASPSAESSPSPAPPPTSLPAASGPDLNAVSVQVVSIASGLNRPIGMANAEDGSGRLFVLEKVGRVRIIQNGALIEEPFLDISDRVKSDSSEQGLLGIAFHPDYASNGYVFIHYSGRGGRTVISRFEVSDDPNRADPASEQEVLTIEQPASNHNGGHLAFGPDGYLYIGMGDGGAAGDVFGNGQNTRSLLGDMLRIDVDELPYSIPSDNPFVGQAGYLPELWAIGLRNPWRYSFDRLTGDLYIADVGQNAYEEVNFFAAGSPAGVNYGWPITEGFHCYDADTCNQSGLTAPVAEYNHSQGCSITGGYVYRGEDYPSLQGVYFFGDYCSGILWGIARDAAGAWQIRELLDSSLTLSSFGEGEDGELYLLDMAGGSVYQLVAGN